MSQWIKCGDDLPDIGVPVIIFLRGQSRVAVIFESSKCYNDLFWSIWDGKGFDIEELTRVRWWMPLPPAPNLRSK